MQILLVLSFVMAAFVAVFALQNAQTTVIEFFGWEKETSVAVIVLVAACVGALVASIVSLISQVALRLRLRQSKLDIEGLEGDLDSARRVIETLKNKVRRWEPPVFPTSKGTFPHRDVRPQVEPAQSRTVTPSQINGVNNERKEDEQKST